VWYQNLKIRKTLINLQMKYLKRLPLSFYLSDSPSRMCFFKSLEDLREERVDIEFLER